MRSPLTPNCEDRQNQLAERPKRSCRHHGIICSDRLSRRMRCNAPSRSSYVSICQFSRSGRSSVQVKMRGQELKRGQTNDSSRTPRRAKRNLLDAVIKFMKPRYVLKLRREITARLWRSISRQGPLRLLMILLLLPSDYLNDTPMLKSGVFGLGIKLFTALE